LRRREPEDKTPVTDTQAYFIGLLIYMQAHTMIVSRLIYRYCCFCYLWY